MSDFPGTSLLPDWYGIPAELPEAEQEFMKKHGLAFSSGYFGMLRCYRNYTYTEDGSRCSNTIWQSSSGWAPVVSAAIADPDEGWPFPKPEQLKEAGRAFLKKAMSLSGEELQKLLDRHVPLL